MTSNSSLKPGRHRLGIVVPYRDRKGHLAQFVPYMQKFLKDLHFEIFIVEQTPEKPFNRGKLLNTGFILGKNKCDYVCFHDIDMLPVQADYSYPEAIVHLATRVEQFDYSMPYKEYIGGVTLFTNYDFEKINGYSNGYWGWGLEDDDLRLRCAAEDLPILSREGIYHSLDHQRPDDKDPLVRANQDRFEEHLYGSKDIHADGLTTLQFELLKTEESPNFHHFLVRL